MMRKLIAISAVLVLALLLTLAPACGKGEEVGPGVTPTPGTPGATPTPTPQAKTFKIGLLSALSGPAAPWGIPFEEGAEWAIDRINEAGGFKVGNDTYMLKLVECDTKMVASVAGECATRLVYDEGIHYVIGPISLPELSAAAPVFNEEIVFSVDFAAYFDPTQFPYAFHTIPLGEDATYIRSFMSMVLKQRPGIKTIAYTNSEGTSQETWHPCELKVAKEFGLTVVGEEFFAGGTTDFYPILTKLVAKKPDAINMESAAPGYLALQIKQARELGYQGIMMAPNGTTPEQLIPVTGVQAAEGFLNNQADYDDPAWPEATKALNQDFKRRYPHSSIYTLTISGFATVNLYVQGMQAAGTTDPAKVKTVFDDPNFTFDFFGFEEKLGGHETYGLARWYAFPNALSVFTNGQLKQLDFDLVEVP